MIEYKTETVKQEVPDIIVCDVCKNAYCCTDGWIDVQEFTSIKFTGGYGSIFGDGGLVKCNICQHCLKKLIGNNLTIELEDDEL